MSRQQATQAQQAGADAVETSNEGPEIKRRTGRVWTRTYRQELLLLGIILLLVVVFGLLNSNFLSAANLSNTAQDATETAMLAIAETYVIITAGIDLSVGAVLGLSGVVSAMVMGALTASLGGIGAFAAGCAAALAVGVLVGLANGLMIVRVRITPFIATLATLGIATGMTMVLTNGVDVQGVPQVAATLGNSVFAAVFTLPIVVTILAAVIGGIYLHKSRFGRWTYALGSNAAAARGAGIPTQKHLISIYLLSGMISSIAGLLDLMRLGTGSPLEGVNSELNAIAAVVIGGASLFGGVGTMVGSMLGAIILSMVLGGLIIGGVQPNWQTVVTGLLIAGAVAFQQVGRKASV
ncbi:MAG TPA: ABC transporter permease [Spirochaetia bacterium]|nr:ABC transporter permease [Spirochaetia bacterium]